MPSGRRFYFARYRNKHGRSRWFTIGEHGEVTAEAARAKAQRVLQTVAVDGSDPSGEREAFRAAPTVNDLLDRYIAEHVERQNKPSTQDGVKEIVERDLRPEFGHLKVAAVTRQDVYKFHAAQRLGRGKPISSWRCSPRPSAWPSFGKCGLKAAIPAGKSTDILSDTASASSRRRSWVVWARSCGGPKAKACPGRTVGRTLTDASSPAAIELLLYTGCRVSEVLNLRWEHIDFAAGVIKLADTKSGGPQLVTMNAPARQVLKALEAQKGGSEWVLPSVSNPRQPISKDGIEAAWQKIRIAAQIEDVRMHDLRHTVGTYAGQTGANAFLVRDLLRHKNLAMTGRYVNRADSPVRTLSDQVGERIAAAMAGRKPADVVPLNAING